MRPHLRANASRYLLAAVCLSLQAGCTSALTTAALRDALWDGAGHAAETAPDSAAGADAAGPEGTDRIAADVAADIVDDGADADRRRAAVEEAVERLARIGDIDAAARATLVDTLRATRQEDWPVVIEAFSATLIEARPPTRNPGPEPPEDVAQAEPEAVIADPVAVAPPAAPAAAAAAAADTASATETAGLALANLPDPAVAAPEPPPAPALTVRTACFASRVQAWGVFERFPSDRFQPGQEVIVYLELDGLSADQSSAGFTTSIDTRLRMVDADGREVHAWRFDPITETCAARRRDYFARYVVRLPEAACGTCRVEVAVTDALAATTASTSLPCAVE